MHPIRKCTFSNLIQLSFIFHTLFIQINAFLIPKTYSSVSSISINNVGIDGILEGKQLSAFCLKNKSRNDYINRSDILAVVGGSKYTFTTASTTVIRKTKLTTLSMMPHYQSFGSRRAKSSTCGYELSCLEMKKDKSSSSDEQSIEELYRIAMEEDEEWYNSFMKDVLGEENIIANGSAESSNANENANDNLDMKGDNNPVQRRKQVSQQAKRESPREREKVRPRSTSIDQDTIGQRRGRVGNQYSNGDNEIKDDFTNRGRETRKKVQRQQQEPIKVRDYDSDEGEKEQKKYNQDGDEDRILRDHLDDFDLKPKETRRKMRPSPVNDQQQPSNEDESLLSSLPPPQTDTKINEKEGDENNDKEYIIKFEDMFGLEQKIPITVMSKLGYKPADIVKLRAEVLELILEDEIPIPTDENGRTRVPRRWMVESKDLREVKILQKRKKSIQLDNDYKQGDNDGEGSIRMNRRERDIRGSKDGMKRRRRKGESRNPQQRRRRQSKREKSRENVDSKSSSIWMDIPTFKQYLRREADLRLSILGPDWEGWVKGESDWRLNLYQGWLDIVEDGVGDDVFEDISYAPAEMRTRSRNSSSQQNRKSRMNGEGRPRRSRPRPSETGDERRRPRRRPQAPPRIRTNDEEKEDYQSRPPSSRLRNDNESDQHHRRMGSRDDQQPRFPKRNRDRLGIDSYDDDSFDDNIRNRGDRRKQDTSRPRQRRRQIFED
jgi:hypothetical protein